MKTGNTSSSSSSSCSGGRSSTATVNNSSSSGRQFSLTSKTSHYKKVTKPLLERKRRARINQYLNELKNLISDTLHVEEENINKLEKADILELTVKHMHCLAKEKQSNPTEDARRFRAGYSQCAYETQAFLSNLSDLKNAINDRLLQHLKQSSSCQQSIIGGSLATTNSCAYAAANEESTAVLSIQSDDGNAASSMADCCAVISSSNRSDSQIYFQLPNSSKKFDPKQVGGVSSSHSIVREYYSNNDEAEAVYNDRNQRHRTGRPMWRPW